MRATIGCVLALALAGCGGASPDAGLDDVIRVEGAQFVRGPMPGDEGGPEVTNAGLTAGIIRRGRTTSVTGLVPKAVQALAIGAQGDRGYWIVTPGIPDVVLTDQLVFTARLSVSPAGEPRQVPLEVRAADGAGRFGPPFALTLATTSEPLPDGPLVVSLAWDTEADLDLHLVDPDGVEIWAHDINSYQPPPPGQLPDPTAWQKGGILDFDSNAACAIDGRRLENIYWTQAPPSGRYVARVDTFSLCGEATAVWTVSVRSMGQEIAGAHGQARDADVRGDHGPGSGLTAVQFDVP